MTEATHAIDGGWVLSQYTDGEWHVFEILDKPFGHGFAQVRARYDVNKAKAIALLLTSAPETAAERDDLREINAELLAAFILWLCACAVVEAK